MFLLRTIRRIHSFILMKLSTSILSVRNAVGGRLEFGDIEVDQLNFKLKTYKDANDTNLGIFVDKLDVGKPRAPGTPPFYFSSSDIEVRDSRFRLIDENKETEEVLNFKQLDIDASDFLILGPEVTTSIEGLSLQSKIGIDIDRLATEFRYTKQQMRFDSLQIQTPGSYLKGNLVFNYNREDLSDFLNKVNIDAQFNESIVAFDEVNMLYNQFGKGKEVTFSSTFNGVLNDLNVEQLFLQSDNTGIRGNFNFKDLFKDEEPFVLNARYQEYYYQLLPIAGAAS